MGVQSIGKLKVSIEKSPILNSKVLFFPEHFTVGVLNAT